MQNPITISCYYLKKKKIVYLFIILLAQFIPTNIFGQSADSTQKNTPHAAGGIEGKIVDKKGQPIPFAILSVFEGGVIKGMGKTNFNGNFKIKNLHPGLYTVRVSSYAYEKVSIKDVQIHSSELSHLFIPPLNAKTKTLRKVKIVSEEIYIETCDIDDVPAWKIKKRRKLIDPATAGVKVICCEEIRALPGGYR